MSLALVVFKVKSFFKVCSSIAGSDGWPSQPIDDDRVPLKNVSADR
jgi:hypothetical protein